MRKKLTEEQIKWWHEGTCHKAHEILGANTDADGTHFAVWAPRAHSASVVGEFNNWDGRANPMEKEDSTGIWTTYIPGIEEWELYKFELKTGEDTPPFLKSDPYAKARELRPKTASLVYNIEGFDWEDDEWLEERPPDVQAAYFHIRSAPGILAAKRSG